ncbi:hypothetical protein PV325_013339 [Microctonus aethiopoides]|nr:hypothetical protein PV325_013339 [Microctonus aethiopoides]KAK0071349.1 hypothetical protein PV326_001344 [Microctonus aethiopoides]
MLNNIKDPLILGIIVEVLTHSVEIATAGQGQSQVEVSQPKSYAQSNMKRTPPNWKEESEREKRIQDSHGTKPRKQWRNNNSSTEQLRDRNSKQH